MTDATARDCGGKYCNLMDEGIPMDKNLRILVVNNDSLKGVLAELNLSNIANVSSAADAIKLYVEEHKEQPFDVTFMNELPNNEELELLKSITEITPDHYVVMLVDDITPDKVLNSIKFGANGLLNKPFTVHKVEMELEKYKMLREDKRASAS